MKRPVLISINYTKQMSAGYLPDEAVAWQQVRGWGLNRSAIAGLYIHISLFYSLNWFYKDVQNKT